MILDRHCRDSIIFSNDRLKRDVCVYAAFIFILYNINILFFMYILLCYIVMVLFPYILLRDLGTLLELMGSIAFVFMLRFGC